jgi:hypothetical protein
VGDDGFVWLHYNGGGSAKILPSDVDKNNILSLAIPANLFRNFLIVRYYADGVNCKTEGRSDVRGVYLADAPIL